MPGAQASNTSRSKRNSNNGAEQGGLNRLTSDEGYTLASGIGLRPWKNAVTTVSALTLRPDTRMAGAG